jgi:hypothetical protein
MAPPTTTPKARTMQQLLQECTPERKLLILGPGQEKLQDSRFTIAEIGENYIAIRLLGDEQMIIPFSSLIMVKRRAHPGDAPSALTGPTRAGS